MKRPWVMAFLFMVIGCLEAMAMQDKTDDYLSAVLFSGNLVALLIVFKTHKITERKIFPVILCVFFSALGYYLMQDEITLAEKYDVNVDEYVHVRGKVTDVSMEKYSIDVTIKLSDGAKLLLVMDMDMIKDIENIYNEEIDKTDETYETEQIDIIEPIYELQGATIEVYGRAGEMKESRNPGNFDERKYYYSRGIYGKIKVDSWDIVDVNNNPVFTYFNRIKQSFTENLMKICPEKEAGVLMAILYGEKEAIDEDTKSTFSDGGISHILAISGLHISIVGMGLFALLRKVLSVNTASIVSSIIMIAYGIVTGGSISSIRAIIMFFIALLAKVLGDIYDMKNALALAGIILITDNPYILTNTGFQLSFAAVIAIAFGLPIINDFIMDKKTGKNNGYSNNNPHIKRLISGINRIKQGFLVSNLINVFNFPIVANTYFEVATYGVFLNIMVIPLMSIVVLSGIMGLLGSYISIWMGKIIIFPAVIVIRFYRLLCDIATKLPFSKTVTGHLEVWQSIIYYCGLALVCLGVYLVTEKRRMRKEAPHNSNNKNNSDNDKIAARVIRKFTSNAIYRYLWVIFILFLFQASVMIASPERNRITFIDVGQGDCSLFIGSEGTVCMVDAGSSSESKVGKYRIIPCLKYCGIDTIDYLFLSHSDDDHINAVPELIEDSCISVKHIVISPYDEGFTDIEMLALQNGIEIIYAFSGMTFSQEGMNIEVISPIEDRITQYSDINEMSLVMQVDMSGKHILFTGDIGGKAEKILLESGVLKNIDILKVAHHGSKYSGCEEFLKEISPEEAVISCGISNSYGHPHVETLDRLGAVGAGIYRTDRYGAIILTFSPSGEVEIEEYKHSKGQ